MQLLPWIIALACVAALASMSTVLLLRRRRRPRELPPLPTEWALSPRPVFSSDERRVYRLLREALPHHAVLAKLPLIRFCQATDPTQTRFWYDLLGTLHVTFVVCSANGRVLAAIDLDTEHGGSRRAMQIKQAVLGACRVRYLRCPVDNPPTIAELQLLVPQTGLAARGPIAMPRPFDQARDTLTSTVASRRAQRSVLWQDSTNFQDSFFAPDNRLDGMDGGEFEPHARNGDRRLADREAAGSASFMPREDIAGVVTEETGEFVTRH